MPKIDLRQELRPVPGFQSLTTHHCVTGSMRNVYVYNNHNLSEDLLLGIGNGVGFVYWHMKGTPPFVGGRGNARGGFEPLVGERTGVRIEAHTTGSARQAEQALLEMLAAGQPVMIGCDMGFLPYFDFGGQEYHFGGHAVVACGYDAETRQVLIADRDGELHPVLLETLARARGSRYKPFPPQNLWYTFDFSAKRPPTAPEVRQAIDEQTEAMLKPPIQNLGVAGIRKTAHMVPKWPALMDETALRSTLFNAFIMIDATGGTGGGLFRYMFSRFLLEAAAITGEKGLEESAADFARIGDRWQAVAGVFQSASSGTNPAAALEGIPPLLHELHGLEGKAWLRLSDLPPRPPS
jgi:hypothetical protein